MPVMKRTRKEVTRLGKKLGGWLAQIGTRLRRRNGQVAKKRRFWFCR